MNRRGHGKFRFAAVSVLVVLALTGFSTGKSRHHGSHGDSDGGGCSSSRQDHDGSSSSGGTTTSGGSSESTPPAELQDATTNLVSCATKKTPYATVSVGNPNAVDATFSFEVEFLNDQADVVYRKATTAYVSANSSTDVSVNVDDTSLFSRFDHCRVEPYAPVVD
ncbi:hypothetical protein [Streptomyces sp. NBC_00582]|uniref:hypothetical protein n=1 Tax=Streptomyces sp. NBC_00582 TaxID=2975783 RepID=UPI001064424E|nr:hypothetical protein [Streptomyces sp. NBC_00582]WUB63761.1 hypothetical protein OG852_26880 [Streptomyces sp. NBC_00582]